MGSEAFLAKIKVVDNSLRRHPAQKRVAIVFGIDKNYTMPLTVCIRSLLESSRGPALKDIYILHSELEEGQKDPVRNSLVGLGNFELHWIPVKPEIFASLSPGLPHVSRATYFRFLAPSLLPESVEVALYLDCDTVVRDDVEKLFAHFDPVWKLQACRDYVGYFSCPILQLKELGRFGIDPEAAYFNSGVLLINMKTWRKEKLAERILDFAADNPDCLFIADQNSINIVLYKQIGTLPPEWNTQAIYPKLLDGTWTFPYIPQPSMAEAKIYHYTSEIKPWNTGANLEAAVYFHEARSRTAWGNTAVVGS